MFIMDYLFNLCSLNYLPERGLDFAMSADISLWLWPVLESIVLGGYDLFQLLRTVVCMNDDTE